MPKDNTPPCSPTDNKQHTTQNSSFNSGDWGMEESTPLLMGGKRSNYGTFVMDDEPNEFGPERRQALVTSVSSLVSSRTSRESLESLGINLVMPEDVSLPAQQQDETNPGPERLEQTKINENHDQRLPEILETFEMLQPPQEPQPVVESPEQRDPTLSPKGSPRVERKAVEDDLIDDEWIVLPPSSPAVNQPQHQVDLDDFVWVEQQNDEPLPLNIGASNTSTAQQRISQLHYMREWLEILESIVPGACTLIQAAITIQNSHKEEAEIARKVLKPLIIAVGAEAFGGMALVLITGLEYVVRLYNRGEMPVTGMQHYDAIVNILSGLAAIGTTPEILATIKEEQIVTEEDELSAWIPERAAIYSMFVSTFFDTMSMGSELVSNIWHKKQFAESCCLSISILANIANMTGTGLLYMAKGVWTARLTQIGISAQGAALLVRSLGLAGKMLAHKLHSSQQHKQQIGSGEQARLITSSLSEEDFVWVGEDQEEQDGPQGMHITNSSKRENTIISKDEGILRDNVPLPVLPLPRASSCTNLLQVAQAIKGAEQRGDGRPRSNSLPIARVG